ncbi:MAG: Lrp/AsnC ligand binding domain-containing protein [Chloroflexi bacterium]|nr:Lrp/AsnC ligand binding domain-containing protein [Chloroflexota bacterium]
MVKAYVLIEMVAGQSMRLVQALRASGAVQGVDRVTGPYDVIAVITAEDINKISDIVHDRIHTLDGVVRTTTCIVIG